MSISLLVTERDDRNQRIVPIATEDIFSRYWEPLSSQLDLKWLPLFQSGFFVDRQDIPFVVSDLRRARQHFLLRQPDEAPEEVLKQITTRITKLISELEELQKEDAVEVYIG